MERPVRLSIEALARAADVPVRTIRYYISEGLLPGPAARGRAAAYDEEHLARLRLIRRLVEQHVPLAELRARLAQLTAAEIEALLRTEQRRDNALRRARHTSSPQDYIAGLLSQARRGPAATPAPLVARAEPSVDPASTWQRFELVPGVELHVRADAALDHARLMERLLRVSRDSASRTSDQDTAFHVQQGEST